MKHVLSRGVVLTVILTLALGVNGYAAGGKYNKQKGRALRGNVDVSRVLAYSFVDEKIRSGGETTSDVTRVPIGHTIFASSYETRGVIFGNTWWDMQHSGSMGRMIETGPHSGGTGYTIVHMGWMYLPDKKLTDQSWAYNGYFSTDHSMVGQTIVMSEDDNAGFSVNTDVTPDNRAILGGHNDPPGASTGYSCEFRFDGGAGYATFPNILRVPDSVQDYAQNDPTEYAAYPKFFFQYGTDTVFHVVAQVADNDYSGQAIMYFRKEGFEGSTDTDWDYPPYVVDTVQDVSQDIIGQRTGDRIVMTWVASLPYQEPICDTCSGITIYDGYVVGQKDNDVYYQQSFDQGVTWEPRVNLTRCPIGGECNKAYADLTLLIDSEDNLHIVWPACPWPADLCWDEGGFCWEEDWYIDNARLEHWSENVPYIRPIADQVYEIQSELWDSCGPGAWSLRITKPTISECDGKLYTIWTQFNNPKTGLIDDCAEWGYHADDPSGAANGDLWLSVSSDWGMTWDYQRNLTESYTPHCDPKFGENCQSDNWPTMSRYGRQVQAGEDWSGAVVVDPSGYYTGNHYLDIMFVSDLDAGAVVQSEGSWTDNPMKWFRIPCVDPGVNPCCVYYDPWRIGPPAYTKPGQQLDTMIIVTNCGNVEIDYTVTVVEENGPPGWLDVSGLGGPLGTGLGAYHIGTIHLNVGGIITEPGDYYGHLFFEDISLNCYGSSSMPFALQVHLMVRDTVVPPVWDSVMTNCLALTMSSNGNMGRGGRGYLNMDYVRNGGDCDTTALVYMYEGSPLLGRIIGDDTIFISNIWGAHYYDDFCFFPSLDCTPTKYCPSLDAEVFESGVFSDQDETIGLEQIYIAPQSDCNYIIEYLRVFSLDGNEHTGLIIGEGIDWDIPTDYKIDDTGQWVYAANIGGVDGSRNLVYCQGYDAHGLGNDTLYPFNCQYNDERFGGNAFVESYVNGSQHRTYAVRGIVATNDSLQGASWLAGPLYRELTYTTGFSATDSIVDINTILGFETDFTLGASDTYEAVSILATVHQGTLADLQAAIDDGKAWYLANGGMSMFADDDDNGEIDICEGCCVVMGNFYNSDDYFSILDIDDFIEWLLRNPGVPPPPDCPEQLDWGGPLGCGFPDGVINILDLDCMTGFILRGEWGPSGCP